jgi:hypothetical protein
MALQGAPRSLRGARDRLGLAGPGGSLGEDRVHGIVAGRRLELLRRRLGAGERGRSQIEPEAKVYRPWRSAPLGQEAQVTVIALGGVASFLLAFGYATNTSDL